MRAILLALLVLGCAQSTEDAYLDDEGYLWVWFGHPIERRHWEYQVVDHPDPLCRALGSVAKNPVMACALRDLENNRCIIVLPRNNLSLGTIRHEECHCMGWHHPEGLAAPVGRFDVMRCASLAALAPSSFLSRR